MTIYTLVLYIGISALILLLTLGIGHAKMNKYARMQPIVWFLQYFVGSLLIFSGVVKGLDPMGTAYKMVDYFTLLLPTLSFMKPAALAFAFFMIVLEIVLGINMILGHHVKATSILTFLMMLFFTFLTGYNYLTGYLTEGVGLFEFSKYQFAETNIKVTDCGCFGDFLKLKPVETFLKDIVLSLFTVFLMLKAMSHKVLVSSDKKLFSNKETRKGGISIQLVLSTLFTLGISYFCLANFYFDVPMVDFRPFKEGTNIVKAREECSLDKEIKNVTYTYLNKENGKTVQVSKEELMKNDYLWKEKDANDQLIWELQSDLTISELVKKGCESKIQEMDESKQHIFAAHGYSFMVVADNLNKANKEGFKKIVEIADAARKEGIETHALYYYVEDKNNDKNYDDDLDKFRHEFSTAFDFVQSDEKLVKTIIRSSPGLILLKNGTIVKKWHHRQLPSYEQLKEKYLPELSADLEISVSIEEYIPETLTHIFVCKVNEVKKGNFSPSTIELKIMDANKLALTKLLSDTTETGATMAPVQLSLMQANELISTNEKIQWVPNGIRLKDQAWEIVSIK